LFRTVILTNDAPALGGAHDQVTRPKSAFMAKQILDYPHLRPGRAHHLHHAVQHQPESAHDHWIASTFFKGSNRCSN
jgi:hypothetical protein